MMLGEAEADAEARSGAAQGGHEHVLLWLDDQDPPPDRGGM